MIRTLIAVFCLASFIQDRRRDAPASPKAQANDPTPAYAEVRSWRDARDYRYASPTVEEVYALRAGFRAVNTGGGVVRGLQGDAGGPRVAVGDVAEVGKHKR